MGTIVVVILSMLVGTQSETNQNAFLQDVPVTLDTLNLKLEKIPPRSESTWVLARIVTSGPAAIHVEFDQKTGKYVIPAEEILTSKAKGKVEVIKILAGTLKTMQWDYAWETPPRTGRRTESSDLTPFYGTGGLVVCRILEAREGRERFESISLIPTSWEKEVMPALAYLREHAADFSPLDVQKNDEKLQKLLSGENPFLAIAAARVLAEAKALNSKAVSESVASSFGIRQAVMTLLALRAEPQADADVLNSLSSLIAKSKDTETLSGVALGAYLAWGMPEASPAHTRAIQVLKQLNDKLPKAGSPSRSDQYILSIITLTGVLPQSEKASPPPSDK